MGDSEIENDSKNERKAERSRKRDTGRVKERDKHDDGDDYRDKYRNSTGNSRRRGNSNSDRDREVRRERDHPKHFRDRNPSVPTEREADPYENYDEPWDSPKVHRPGDTLRRFPFDDMGFTDDDGRSPVENPRASEHVPRGSDEEGSYVSYSPGYRQPRNSIERGPRPQAHPDRDSQRPAETGIPRLGIGDLVNDGYEVPLDFAHSDDEDKDEKRRHHRYSDVDVEPGRYGTEAKSPYYHSTENGNAPAESKFHKFRSWLRSKSAAVCGADDASAADKDGLVFGQDENEERGNWSGRFDFILSMLGYAVGLGNVWRFPYLCYRNGGGAFLFPFLFMMVVIGLPLFYLEAALGQFSSCGATTCWQFAPLFKGVGVAMVMVSAMTGLYYNMILAWALRYMFASFASDLPFASCNNDWNTKNCKLKWPVVACDGEGESRNTDGSCEDVEENTLGLWNRTLFTEVTGRVLTSPSEEYWERRVLRFSSGIDSFGSPKWDLVLCLLLAWIICFLCLLKGIKTTGKVVYFTAIFPYVVLVILFFRGVTLENAGEGIKFFITPKFSRLADANVWKDAANQIFFSMSIAGGGLITLSSYNRFHNNILRDSLIVGIGDAFTCVLGGFVIFSYLGYMAGQLDVSVEDVATDGAGLAFVVYPEAVSNLPPSTLWALLFFFMLLTLGLDSQFAMLETVLTGILDQYPKYRPQKTLVILGICCVLFLLGLPLTCPGGMYLLQLLDNYVGGMTLIILAFVELVAVIFVYGVSRFCQDINLMTGSTQFLFWKATWCILSPFTIVFIFVFMFVDYKRSTYGEYTYPVWADVLGWFFTLVSVLAVLVTMLFMISDETEGDGVWEKIKLLSLPTVYWGPALPKHRELVNYVQGFQVDPSKGLRPRTSYANAGYTSENGGSLKNGKTLSLKSNGETLSQVSGRASRISMISGTSRATAASDRSGATFETSI